MWFTKQIRGGHPARIGGLFSFPNPSQRYKNAGHEAPCGRNGSRSYTFTPFVFALNSFSAMDAYTTIVTSAPVAVEQTEIPANYEGGGGTGTNYPTCTVA